MCVHVCDYLPCQALCAHPTSSIRYCLDQSGDLTAAGLCVSSFTAHTDDCTAIPPDVLNGVRCVIGYSAVSGSSVSQAHDSSAGDGSAIGGQTATSTPQPTTPIKSSPILQPAATTKTPTPSLRDIMASQQQQQTDSKAIGSVKRAPKPTVSTAQAVTPPKPTGWRSPVLGPALPDARNVSPPSLPLPDRPKSFAEVQAEEHALRRKQSSKRSPLLTSVWGYNTTTAGLPPLSLTEIQFDQEAKVGDTHTYTHTDTHTQTHTHISVSLLTMQVLELFV